MVGEPGPWLEGDLRQLGIRSRRLSEDTESGRGSLCKPRIRETCLALEPHDRCGPSGESAGSGHRPAEHRDRDRRSDGERDKEASGGIRLGVVSPCPDREHRRTEWLSLSVYWLGPTLVIALGAITVGLASPKGWARPTAISLGAAAAIAFVVVTLLQIG